jgi:CRISPR-associated protein Cmr1
VIITRFHDAEKLSVSIEFLTPTFLGGADQNAELRSAPFKNLIRQWWRVVNGNLEVSELRSREADLFGTVLGNEKATVSKVRVAVTPGTDFNVSTQPFQFGKTAHPEVKGGMPVENALYLGYGPIQFGRPTPVFKRYITPGSIANLSINYPQKWHKQIVSTLQLIDAFGTIGSRCRNGYGSLALTVDGVLRLNPATVQCVHLTELINNNAQQYPNRFGRDDNGLLLWESNHQPQWTNAMTLLAGIYLHTRTHINIAGNPNELHERHALGFPLTNHDKNLPHGWDRTGRMPSQLRLMLKRNQNSEVVARILHLPHRLPKPWPTKLPAQQNVWRQVHQFLDHQEQLHRIGGGV